MLVQLPPPSSPSAMSRQNAEHVRLEIRSNDIDNEFAGWERPFAEQEGETGQMLGFYSPKIQFGPVRLKAIALAAALIQSPFDKAQRSILARPPPVIIDLSEIVRGQFHSQNPYPPKISNILIGVSRCSQTCASSCQRARPNWNAFAIVSSN